MNNVFVDFDKTITTGEGKPHWVEPLNEEPRWEIIDIVNELYKKGNTIIIYTARPEEYREETEYFLKNWDVRYHALRMTKPGFDVLIDNRAVSHYRAMEMGADEIDKIIR